MFLALGLVVAGCSTTDSWSTEQAISDALERQPAGLLSDIDEFVLDDAAEPGCGQELMSTLVAVDIATGTLRWERDVPWSQDPPALLGSALVLHSPWVNQLPPSVYAVDATTGAPRWQRFVEDPYLWPVEQGPSGYSVRSDGETFVLDADGELLPDSDTTAEKGDGSDPAVRRSGFELQVGPLGDTPAFTVDLGNTPVEFAAASVVDVDEDHMVIELSSDLGPNNWVVIIDRSSTDVVSMVAGVRSARLAEGNLVFDMRTSATSTEEFTRELLVGPLDEPLAVSLRRQSRAPNAPGGFIGVVDGHPVFAAEGASAAGVAFVGVGGSSEIPDPLRAARLQGTRPPHVVVDDEVIAVATDRGVVLAVPGGAPQLVETAFPVTAITRVDDAVVALASVEAVGCD